MKASGDKVPSFAYRSQAEEAFPFVYLLKYIKLGLKVCVEHCLHKHKGSELHDC